MTFKKTSERKHLKNKSLYAAGELLCINDDPDTFFVQGSSPELYVCIRTKPASCKPFCVIK